jgi:hypothetical protein
VLTFTAKPLEGGRKQATLVLAPIGDWWYLVETEPFENTGICNMSGHAPNCIYYSGGWYWRGRGTWRLKNLIDTSKIGSDVRLEEVYVDAMGIYDWGCVVLWNNRSLAVLTEEGKPIWKVEGDRILLGDRQWVRNKYAVGLPVSGRLGAELWSDISALVAAFSTHYANVTLVFSYVPSPTSPAAVRVYVYDSATARAVPNARVEILEGSTPVAEGYTDTDGLVELKGIPAEDKGTIYALSVTKSGYYPYTGSVTVYPGTNEFRVGLQPSPSETWWDRVKPYLPYAAAVAAAGAAAYLIARRAR